MTCTIIKSFYLNWDLIMQLNETIFFKVHGSVQRKYILIYIRQDATLHSLFYLESALRVSGGTSTHQQKRKQLHLQHLVFVTPLLQPAATQYSNIYPTRCDVTQFILSGNCSTCFGWYLHPSSGARTTVSTASGICQTVAATCRDSGR